MTTDAATDVVVVGGGPAGSSTAIRLARCGVRVTLIDRQDFPRHKPCSEYMSPETVRQLDMLGVLPAIDAAGGAPLDGTTVRAAHGAHMTGRFDRAGGKPFRPQGLGLSRAVLDRVLIDAARNSGVQVQVGLTATDLVMQGDHIAGVVARDQSGATRELRARAVVGADGLRSIVARRAGLHRRGRVARVAFVAHVRGVTDLTPMTELHVSTAGYAGINALGNGVANVALVVPAERAREARGNAPAFFARELERFPGVRGRVDVKQTVREVISVGPFDAYARRSTAHGALLVGDAADFFDPFTGEGICTALRGGQLAADALADALSRPGPITRDRLRSYRSARRRAFIGKWLVERMIGYGMFAPMLFDRAVARIERRRLADTLIGVTGHFVSPWRVINPWFLARMVW